MDSYEVRRADGELVGFVETQDDRWRASTVFGAELAVVADEETAVGTVLDAGLSVLTEPWWHHDGTEWHRVVLLEAGPRRVTVRFEHSPEPGTRPRTLTGQAARDLRRQPV